MRELTFDELDAIWEGLEHQAPIYMARAAIAADRALNGSAALKPAPIDMVLYCPACGMQHIDKEDEPTGENDGPDRIEYIQAGGLTYYADGPTWINPPHRSHLCAGCGHTWRPADVPTNGVAAVKTRGKNDSPIGSKE